MTLNVWSFWLYLLHAGTTLATTTSLCGTEDQMLGKHPTNYGSLSAAQKFLHRLSSMETTQTWLIHFPSVARIFSLEGELGNVYLLPSKALLAI